MTRRHIGSLIDRKAINNINDNFKELFDEYVGAGMDAEEARDKAEQALADSILAKTDAEAARDIAESVRDDLIAIIREQTSGADVVPEVVQARHGADTLGENIESIRQNLSQSYQKVTNEFVERLPNLKTLGASLDGVGDDYDITQWALDNYGVILLPAGSVLGTSETIQLKQGQGFVSPVPNTRGLGIGGGSPPMTSMIRYIGEKDNRKAVITLGKNAVGSEPVLDGSNITLENVLIDASNKAGFGVYGTYLTNETRVNNVVAMNTLEYGMYIAKSWYASLTNLVSLNSRGQGLAFGMPLEYLDGSKIDWISAGNLEINNVFIRNVRSIRSGLFFQEENQRTYDPYNSKLRRKGYGIGFGVGNGFSVEGYLSEASGGANLYIYTGSQPVKSIRSGYLESANVNSGLDSSTEIANVIIENTSPTGGAIEIRDLFTNYNSGGIYHTGEKRKVWLRNVHQPRFLKSLDGESSVDLYSYVLKDNVHHECGTYNTDMESATPEVVTTENVRYSFSIDILNSNTAKILYIKTPPGGVAGSFTAVNEDGTTYFSRNYPDTGGKWERFSIMGRNVVEVRQGATPSTDANVGFAVLKLKNTTH